MFVSRLRILVALCVFAYSVALAQTMAPVRSEGDPPPPATPAPAVSPSGVMMMAPIPDGTSQPAALQASQLGRGPAGPAVLSPADHLAFIQAHDAADRRDWARARSFAAQGTDAVARDLVTWRYVLDENSGAGFDEISAFIASHPGWPRRETILANAEKAMRPEMSGRDVAAWFGTRAPSTSQGALRLGKALIETGKQREGEAAIRKAWIEGRFSQSEETQILASHGALFSSADQKLRLEHLLMSEDTQSARRQMGRVDADSQRVAEARLTMRATPNRADRVADTLSATQRSDPGFIYEESRALRRAGMDASAWAAMMRAPTGKQVLFPERWWTERHIMARDALKAQQRDIAYTLVSGHGLSSGSSFADAEWLAGFIALRFKNDPARALTHFNALANAVSYPISRARAHYWIGRAYEAQGNKNEAAAAYMRAGKDSLTYYGQLALLRVDASPSVTFPDKLPNLAAARAKFEADEIARATRILGDLGQKYLLRIFALHAASTNKDPASLYLLGELAMAQNDRALAVKIAKSASYGDVVLTPYLFPIVPIPQFPGAGTVPEAGLILGITRQESEFDPEVVSSAGAIGLMQLMPASARATARDHGLPYRQADLSADPEYNMKLGQAHLGDGIARWNGSYILAIASYNAGPNNAQKWVETYGDPRSPTIDPIDWVELIPFGETRNYVQRVLENTQVYRARLGAANQRILLLHDLYRPANAPSQPILKYEPPAASVPAEPPAPKTAPKRTTRGTSSSDLRRETSN